MESRFVISPCHLSVSHVIAELVKALEEEGVAEKVVDRVLKKLFAEKKTVPTLSPEKEPKKKLDDEDDVRSSRRQSGLFGY